MDLYNAQVLGMKEAGQPGYSHAPQGEVGHAGEGRGHDGAARETQGLEGATEVPIPRSISTPRVIGQRGIQAQDEGGVRFRPQMGQQICVI